MFNYFFARGISLPIHGKPGSKSASLTVQCCHTWLPSPCHTYLFCGLGSFGLTSIQIRLWKSLHCSSEYCFPHLLHQGAAFLRGLFPLRSRRTCSAGDSKSLPISPPSLYAMSPVQSNCAHDSCINLFGLALVGGLAATN